MLAVACLAKWVQTQCPPGLSFYKEIQQKHVFPGTCSVSGVSKVNSWRFGVTLSGGQLNRKASSTVILSAEAAGTETEIAVKHRRLLSCNFSVLCSKSVYFQKRCLSSPFRGVKFPTCASVSLCLNGLRMKLHNALLLQSTQTPRGCNFWRDQGVSLRTDDTKQRAFTVSQGDLDSTATSHVSTQTASSSVPFLTDAHR